MRKAKKRRKPGAPASFKVGEHVRVRYGDLDQQRSEAPRSGSAGTITKIGRRGMCLVRLTPESPASLSPSCEQRPTSDVAVSEAYWLAESELDLEDRDILPDLAEFGLTADWLQVVALVTSIGAVLGPAFATMTWSRWAAGIGAALLGLTMALGQAKAAQKHPFSFMRGVNIAFALVSGLLCGAAFGAMVVAFVGALLGVAAWLLLEWLYRTMTRSVVGDLPGSRTIAAACGVVAESFYINSGTATAGLCCGALIGLGCAMLLVVALLTTTKHIYKNMPELTYWRITPQGHA
jgi:hypothetical protein